MNGFSCNIGAPKSHLSFHRTPIAYFDREAILSTTMPGEVDKNSLGD
jgi:hypothetical protein